MADSTPNNVSAGQQAGQDAESNRPTTHKGETKKIVRLLTVVAYMMSVSMAALMLSAYYIFLWNPKEHRPHGPLRLVDPCPDCYLPDLDYSGKATMSARSTTQSASGSVRGSIKFAGEEAKDRMYEPKHKKKAVRVLTVIAYVFSVSLAAIMLSMYYIFIWQGTKPSQQQHHSFHSASECRPAASGINHHQLGGTGAGLALNESQLAETPRALPAVEELPQELGTTPLSRLALQYQQLQLGPLADLELDNDNKNDTLPVLINS